MTRFIQKEDIKRRGFTLIEMLVVFAIIGIFTSISVAIVRESSTKARLARAQFDMDQIRKAMIMYKEEFGELPPPGDNCSACSNPPNSSWTNVMTALVNGGFMDTRIDTDPWGNYYGYDDNDCNSNPGVSYLLTAGPDKVSWTADDYTIVVTKGCDDWQ